MKTFLIVLYVSLLSCLCLFVALMGFGFIQTPEESYVMHVTEEKPTNPQEEVPQVYSFSLSPDKVVILEIPTVDMCIKIGPQGRRQMVNAFQVVFQTTQQNIIECYTQEQQKHTRSYEQARGMILTDLKENEAEVYDQYLGAEGNLLDSFNGGVAGHAQLNLINQLSKEFEEKKKVSLHKRTQQLTILKAWNQEYMRLITLAELLDQVI